MELFTKEMEQVIDKRFTKLSKLELKKIVEEVEIAISKLSNEHQLAVKYCYCHMPVSDMVSYPVELFIKSTEHSLMLYHNSGYDVPPDIFLSYVLFYRINNENLELCRSKFYYELYPRIKGKSMKDAVLEVNYWCFEKATYATTDSRTASPLTVVSGGFGRCGEESTLTVTALRAVGIPARQCYTPRWAHCDDNHAWVEAYVDGKFHYLGACEPEPVLDKGWFTAAASRAMLVHTRLFNTVSNSMDEQVTSRTPLFNILNNTPSYAKVKRLKAQVTDNKVPVKGIDVGFSLVNYSEIYPIATVKTNEEGSAEFTTGMGDVLVQIDDGKRVVVKKVNVNDTDINIDFNDESLSGEFTMQPPNEAVTVVTGVSEEHLDRLKNCNELRAAHEAKYNYASDKYKEAQKYLLLAKGNRPELEKFLSLNQFDMEDKIAILSTLTIKDYRDITTDVLVDFLETSLKYKSHEKWKELILAPRVDVEMLTKCRSLIVEFFADKNIDTANKVWDYIKNNTVLLDEYDYVTLRASAVGVLKYNISSKHSNDILFVNICRALGIPARLNPVTHQKETYINGNYITIGEDKCKNTDEECTNKVNFTIINSSKKEMQYENDFTISMLKNGKYHLLNLQGTTIKDKLTIALNKGKYRILTTSRQIDGSIIVKLYDFNTNMQKIEVELPNDRIKEKLKSVHIEDITIKNVPENKDIKLYDMLGNKNVLCFVEIGAEPTEHFFNEVIELSDKYSDVNVIVVVNRLDNLKNATLQKMLKALPHAKLCFSDDHGYVERLHKKMQVGDRRLPFVTAINNSQKGLASFANYNVGTGQTLLNVFDAMSSM